MRKKNPAIDLNFLTAPHSPGGAGKVAESINREANRLVEGRDKKCGGEMSQMMFDMMNGGFDGAAGKSLVEGGLDAGGFANIFHAIQDQTDVGPVRDDKGEASPIVDPGLAIDGDVVEICHGKTAL